MYEKIIIRLLDFYDCFISRLYDMECKDFFKQQFFSNNEEIDKILLYWIRRGNKRNGIRDVDRYRCSEMLDGCLSQKNEKQ